MSETTMRRRRFPAFVCRSLEWVREFRATALKRAAVVYRANVAIAGGKRLLNELFAPSDRCSGGQNADIREPSETGRSTVIPN